MPSFPPRAPIALRLALPKPPGPGNGLNPFPAPWDMQPCPDQGVAPSATSTVPAPHQGFLPDLPNRTTLSPNPQQWPVRCLTCITAWGEGE